MKRSGILNADLCHALGAIGHGDVLMICDAGFPIPRDAWRIDLALVPGVPDHETLFAALAPEFIVETTMFAEEMAANHPALLETARRHFDPRDFRPVPHAELLGPIAARARVIIRSGAFAPWGNFAFVSGVDAPRWFADPAIGRTPFYAERLSRPPRG